MPTTVRSPSSLRDLVVDPMVMAVGAPAAIGTVVLTLVAVALLRDGSQVPVRALWGPATFPMALNGGLDVSDVQNALLVAHRQWLSGQR